MTVQEIILMLKAKRTLLKISHENLALDITVAKSCIGAWERGRTEPTLSRFLDWADALQYSVVLRPKDES